MLWDTQGHENYVSTLRVWTQDIHTILISGQKLTWKKGSKSEGSKENAQNNSKQEKKKFPSRKGPHKKSQQWHEPSQAGVTGRARRLHEKPEVFGCRTNAKLGQPPDSTSSDSDCWMSTSRFQRPMGSLIWRNTTDKMGEIRGTLGLRNRTPSPAEISDRIPAVITSPRKSENYSGTRTTEERSHRDCDQPKQSRPVQSPLLETQAGWNMEANNRPEKWVTLQI